MWPLESGNIELITKLWAPALIWFSCINKYNTIHLPIDLATVNSFIHQIPAEALETPRLTCENRYIDLECRSKKSTS